MNKNIEAALEEKKVKQKIKCVIWDLDNTIWDGTLIEDNNVTLRNGVDEIIKAIDERGILQSIASKNDYDMAMAKLKELGLEEYFIYPQIHWNSKSSSIKIIAQSINIGVNTLAFVDDQPFEREEVNFACPEVLCIDSVDLNKILDMEEMIPKFISEDSKLRRKMYMSDIRRNKEEEGFDGAQQEFLETLGMVFTISPVGEGDLQRAEELTVRTHQLNATGYTYSYEELDSLRKSNRHKLFIAGLEDKYGTYGKIGLTLVECAEDVWTLKLLLMSCRVMSRGVGTVMMSYIMNLAKRANVHFRAEFVPTDVNRMMYITYKFAGFKEIEEKDGLVILENDLTFIQPLPEYIKLNVI
jgi:FkbH-like protein